jgi:Glycosyltransferase family 9 (heptosyltransferase)
MNRLPHSARGAPHDMTGEALVDSAGQVWLPYDLPHLPAPPAGLARLSSRRECRHAGRAAFRWCAPASGTLRILNGMGVTLGDSIIGMNALAWLKHGDPSLRIELYRSRHTPAVVERLYELARAIVDQVHYLPLPLGELPADVIDLSDFVHWPVFATAAMVDFFAQGLGIAAGDMPASMKANRWLAEVAVPNVPGPWADRPYALLCADASTPLRSMPDDLLHAMVERIWRRYRLPVLGFRAVPHPHHHEQYHDVSAHSRSLDQYLAWVKGAQAVVGTDSSALHIAAGFDVPTLAVFVSIDPALRVRDYPHCHALDISTPATRGQHANDDPQLLRGVHANWRDLMARATLPWPEIAASQRAH